jgi:sugar phosphate isomerase/epimerase
MLIHNHPPLHLTYCLNIHPGESLADNIAAIRAHTLKVRDSVSGGKPFGLGLRLSASAARELSDPARLAAFKSFLRDERLYAFTINGFPYGKFHDTAVKENVYRPDWQDTRRREYTIQLADILAALLPEGVTGSISTLPGSYKPWIAGEKTIVPFAEASTAGRVKTIVSMLAETAAHMDKVRRRTGREICLALEPEPDCLIETTSETIAFFQGPLKELGRDHLKSMGLTSRDADNCLCDHLGVCLDTAHAAVEFEDLAQSVRQFQQAGIKIAKVQLSAALSLEPTDSAMKRLADFNDPVYLHQVKVRGSDGQIGFYRDLPDALADAKMLEAYQQLRVHFHVPLFCDNIEPLSSTASLMTSDFWKLLKGGATSHAEIETYTFNVLPPDLQSADVTDSIVREYQWVMGKMMKP